MYKKKRNGKLIQRERMDTERKKKEKYKNSLSLCLSVCVSVFLQYTHMHVRSTHLFKYTEALPFFLSVCV